MTYLDYIPRWVMAAVIAILVAASCQFKLEAVKLSIDLEKEKTRVAELNAGIQAANATAATQAARFEQQARAAEQARSAREQTLLADAAGAKSELERLRVAVYGLPTPASAAAAVPETPRVDAATAAADLLTVSQRYIDLAEKCDRHALDIKTLLDAWPQ